MLLFPASSAKAVLLTQSCSLFSAASAPPFRMHFHQKASCTLSEDIMILVGTSVHPVRRERLPLPVPVIAKPLFYVIWYLAGQLVRWLTVQLHREFSAKRPPSAGTNHACRTMGARGARAPPGRFTSSLRA